MKLSFMTLGCPKWDLDTICARGREYGFDGVDFRGYLDTLDITTLPMFSSAAEQTRRQLNDAGLAVSAISSSIRVCDPNARQANLDEAKRTIVTARGLGAGIVRIFGAGNLEQHTRNELAQIGCSMIEEILALDGAKDIHWVFETHDLWIKSEDCTLLLKSIPNPNFGALWDMGHTYRVGKETPEQTFAAIGPRVGYVHVKDATFDPDHPNAMNETFADGPVKGWRYVIPGTGQLPLADSIGLLKATGYDGWLLCEHEKRWHPTLAEPEEIFPAFIAWAKPLIG
ncbi:MAG: sugar phosphate isomerase/epimerase [Roseiflexaceae bacterium]